VAEPPHWLHTDNQENRRDKIDADAMQILFNTVIFYALVLFTACLPIRGGAQPATMAGNRVKEFKRFISEPPVIAQLIAHVCRRQSETNADFDCRYVLLRMQENAFLFREAPALDKLTSTNVFLGHCFAGFYDDAYWYFTPEGSTLEFSTNRQENLRKALEFVFTMYASPILNLGIFDSIPGVVTWNENNITPFTNKWGVLMVGVLFMDSEGRPKRIALSTAKDNNIVPWEIEYNFSVTNALPDYLPSKISALNLRNNSRQLAFKVELLSIELSNHELPRMAFMPGVFGLDAFHTVLLTDKGPLGRSKLDRFYQPVSATSRAKSPKLGIILFLIGNLAVAYIIYFSKKRMSVEIHKSNSQMRKGR